MQQAILDCTGLETRDDFYNAFFKAVGAPAWHGRNFNALNDSIFVGNINKVELPYEIVVLHQQQARGEAADIVEDFIRFIEEHSAQRPVSIRCNR